MGKKYNREFTPAERKRVKNLVQGECANYSYDFDCLLLDCKCIMTNIIQKGAHCRYFRQAVLPLDRELEVIINSDTNGKERVCPVCGIHFFQAYNEKFCSEKCRVKRKREVDANRSKIYRRKKRRNKD